MDFTRRIDLDAHDDAITNVKDALEEQGSGSSPRSSARPGQRAPEMDDASGTAARHQVQGIPTPLLFEGGRRAARQTGALPAHALTDRFDAHAPEAA